MALIDDLISRVTNEGLRADLENAVGRLREGLNFGLVFEEHELDVLPTPEVPVRAGSLAMDNFGRLVTVESVREEGSRSVATVAPRERGDSEDLNSTDLTSSEELNLADLTSVARLGDPVFATLRRIDSVTGAGCDDHTARHIAIEAENYQALELLAGIYAQQVDCIYIDPPYNSGATDWKYNNRFVDSSDRYRHSKWLSMMQRRLKLARQLLKPDGVLIVTIDENEVHHLGVLLQQLFPGATHQMVTMVTTHVGNSRGTFSRVEEYALYMFSGTDPSVCERPDDLLTGDANTGNRPPDRREVRWVSLLRSGNNSRPQDRPGLVYPVWIDSQGRIVSTGRTLKQRISAGNLAGNSDSLDNFMPPSEQSPHPGAEAVWPRKRTGALACWGLGPSTLMKRASDGYVRASGSQDRGWSLQYLSDGQIEQVESKIIKIAERDPVTGAVSLEPIVFMKKPMSVWHRSRHDAGQHGTVLLKELLGGKRFDFPKSLYSTLDAIAAVMADRKDALILDFFAGSGTTLHAVAALNAADGGRRRCVAVSNNDLSQKEDKQLRKNGFAPGDPEWEAQGIFRYVLMPRTRAAITGILPDGEPVEGKYLPPLYERPLSDGFAAGVEFFELVCDDPQRLISGDCFDEIHPLLWAASGACGPCPTKSLGDAEAIRRHEPGWLLPDDSIIPLGCTYSVLLRPSRLDDFVFNLDAHHEVTHVFTVAADRDELRHVEERLKSLNHQIKVGWLFEDLYQRYSNRGST